MSNKNNQQEENNDEVVPIELQQEVAAKQAWQAFKDRNFDATKTIVQAGQALEQARALKEITETKNDTENKLEETLEKMKELVDKLIQKDNQ